MIWIGKTFWKTCATACHDSNRPLCTCQPWYLCGQQSPRSSESLSDPNHRKKSPPPIASASSSDKSLPVLEFGSWRGHRQFVTQSSARIMADNPVCRGNRRFVHLGMRSFRKKNKSRDSRGRGQGGGLRGPSLRRCAPIHRNQG